MHKLLTVIFLSSFLSGSAQADVIIPVPLHMDRGGGVVVGNGGYSIQCDPSQSYRSYDLLMAESSWSPPYQHRLVTTSKNSLQRIRALIATKLPAFKASFDEYVDEIFTSDPSKKYIWFNTSPDYVGGWILPPDERTSNHQEVCPGDHDPSQVSLQQTILRQSHQISDQLKVTFFYDVLAFSALPELDRSFLLVHEWLWNYTDDLNTNRAVDYLLHSTWIESASSKDVIEKFKELKFQYPYPNFRMSETTIR